MTEIEDVGNPELITKVSDGSRRKTHHSVRPLVFRGFTLVELLIAIAIIGILMAIAIPAAYNAFKRAKIAGMKMEVTNLSIAIEEYRQKYGDYPPDGSDVLLLQRHMRKVFPRMLNTEFTELAKACKYVADSNKPFKPIMNRAEALVFFFGWV